MSKQLNNQLNKLMHNEKGAALVVTLTIVVVLMVAALQLRKMTLGAVTVGQLAKDQFYAEQKALSGINLACLILAEDAQKNDVDSIQEEWADDEWLAQAVSTLGYNSGALTLKITDEKSKIQVNAFLKDFPGNQINTDQMRIWEKLIQTTMLDDDQTDTAPVINCLKDWMDSLDDDAVSGISGAESDYYMGLDPPYECANGPLTKVQELFLIKGISKDMLGSDIPGFEEGEDQLISPEDFLTVFGLDNEAPQEGKYRYSGRININTAPVNVLSALLPEGLEDLAQDLADFRAQKGEQGLEFTNSLDKGWYKRVIDLSDTELVEFERTIDYASSFFRVDAVATENKVKVKMVAFLKREQEKETGSWTCRIIRMERKY